MQEEVPTTLNKVPYKFCGMVSNKYLLVSIDIYLVTPSGKWNAYYQTAT